MPHLIEELWLFSKDGIPIAEILKDVKVDPVFMGGMLSALESFSKQISDKGLHSFSFGEKKFIVRFALNGEILVVVRSNINSKMKKIKKILDFIIELFEKLHVEEDIKNWDGNVGIFDEFREKLELYFEMSQL